MATIMTLRRGSFEDTRPSFVKRLQADDDSEAWLEFDRTYRRVIRYFARRAGLSEEDAKDVEQNTVVGVARRLPGFVYEPKVCRFKTWLLIQTRWQIRRWLAKNAKAEARLGRAPGQISPAASGASDSSVDTDPIAQLPDPAVPEFGREWDEAWERNLFQIALHRLRQRIDERQFQIFDLYVTKAWAAQRVAQALGISVARVYLAKHRVTRVLKEEVERLQKAAEQKLRKRD